MPLDIWVYGSGFGETIILSWNDEEAKSPVAAVIDCHGGDTSITNPALARLAALSYPPLAFVAVSHPHLDHIRNSHILLRNYPGRIDRIFWWGGFDPEFASLRYKALGYHSLLRGREPGEAARMAAKFLDYARRLAGHLGGKSAPIPFQSLLGDAQSELILSGLTIRAIGPWTGPLQSYIKDFRNQFAQSNGVTSIAPDRVRANRCSMGLLVTYKGNDAVFGGDMELDNWSWFNNAYKESDFTIRPSFIKVSHHGSKRSVTSGMWHPAEKFFNSNSASPSAMKPICVITPWRKPGMQRRLPDAEMKQRILEAGCPLVVTGSVLERTGIESRHSYCDSYVHIEMMANGKALIKDSMNCEINTPK